MGNERTAIVLMNLGGPDSLEGVESFLFNIFSDPDVIQLPLGFLWQKAFARRIARTRVHESQANYQKIGGRSPILEHTKRQGALLEQALGEGFKTYIAMRAAPPNTDDAVRALKADKPDRIVALPLYPQRSRTTTVSSMRELYKVLDREGVTAPVHEVCCYPVEPLFLDAWAERVRQTLDAIPEPQRAKTHVLFSAHGLPQSVIDKGDPYLVHVQATVKGVMQRVGEKWPHSIAFQSRATRSKWLEPATEHALAELAKSGVRDVAVVPIAFLTDHIETLYELDMLIKDQALAAGITGYHRVAALNESSLLVKGLAGVVRRALAKPAGRHASEGFPEVCSAAGGHLNCPLLPR